MEDQNQDQFQPVQSELVQNQPQDNYQPPQNRWVGILSLAVIVVAALYFLNVGGVGDWLEGALTPSFSEGVNNNDGGQAAEPLPSVGGVGDKSVSAPEKGKSLVKIVITAGVTDGAVLVSGNSEANLELKQILFHNPSKDSWFLVYDGVRPLSLLDLSASGDKHQLIETEMAALNYDQVRIVFSDIFVVGGQRVGRDRTVDVAGVVVKEGVENIINVRFSMDDPFRPLPFIEIK